MEVVNIPTPKGKVLAYNEANPFTRRNPTFLTKKQQERDSKIARQIIHASDVEEDKQIFILDNLGKIYRLPLNRMMICDAATKGQDLLD